MEFLSDSSGNYFVKDAENIYKLYQNILNLWAVDREADCSTVSTNCLNKVDCFTPHSLGEIELVDHIFVHEDNSEITAAAAEGKRRRRKQLDQNLDMNDFLNLGKDEQNSFTLGDLTDPIIQDFHSASSAFDTWQPDTQSGKTFKSMVENLEKKHKR